VVLVTVRRQFHAGDESVALVRNFALPTVPTIGSVLLLHDDVRLAVVGVTLSPVPAGAGIYDPTVTVETEWEPLAAAETARERGWAPVSTAE
jgi:hypothetical protein